MSGQIERAALTVKGLQHYLSISRSSVYRLVGAGKIRPVKLGGRTLFLRADADAMLAAARAVANADKRAQPQAPAISWMDA